MRRVLRVLQLRILEEFGASYWIKIIRIIDVMIRGDPLRIGQLWKFVNGVRGLEMALVIGGLRGTNEWHILHNGEAEYEGKSSWR